MYLSPRKKLFVDTASEMFGEGAIITKQNTRDAAEKAGVPFPGWFRRSCNVAYNAYKLPSEGGEAAAPIAAAAVETGEAVSTVNLVATNMEKQDLVPALFEGFVAWGNFSLIEKVVKSNLFYPIFVTGLSGNGKTLMVEQTCAALKRELYRVNITIETDEDDLMGGHTLINGNICFREGPVIKAMRKGAVLLLDEVDLGSNKLMCMQSVLEGKGYLIKKTGEWVTPKAGFTVLATANTKGQGSEDGKFIGTQIMNEAMLERFAITMMQEYPPIKTEVKILHKEMELTGDVDEEFCKKLVDWADIIRKTYYEGAIDDVVTTRRLVHIVNAFRMFGDKLKSISMCISRFDEETRNSILDLYSKIDAGVDLNAENPFDPNAPIIDDDLSDDENDVPL